MALMTSLLAGLLFGLGLAISGMIDPARVTGFLDVAGAWDPSLAFVMGGRPPCWIAVSSVAPPCLASAGVWWGSVQDQP